MESISIKVDLTEEDIYSFQKAYILKNMSPVFIIIIGIFLFAFVANTISAITREAFSIGALLPAIGPLIMVVVFVVIIPVSVKKSSKSLLDTNKLLQKTNYYTIGNEGVEISTESSNAIIKWSELYKAIEVKDSFLFYLSERQSYVIPKRYLAENMGQLELMRSYIKNAPVPKKKRGLFGSFRFVYLLVLLFVIIVFILTLYSNS